MEVIVTSGFMGVSSLEGSGLFFLNYFQNPSSSLGFPVSRKPISKVALNTKKVSRIELFSLRASSCRIMNVLSEGEATNRSSSDGFLEKEFRFQPTFDEYLKAMESVKNIKEIQDGSQYDLKNESRRKETPRKFMSEDDEDNKMLDASEGHEHQMKGVYSIKRNALFKKSGREGLDGDRLNYKKKDSRGLKHKSKLNSDKVSGEGIIRNNQGLAQSKLDGLDKDELDKWKHDVDLKVNRESGGDEFERSLKGTSGRWKKDQPSSLKQQFEEIRFNKSMEEQGINRSYWRHSSIQKVSHNLFSGKKQMVQNRKDDTGKLEFGRSDAAKKPKESDNNLNLINSGNYYITDMERKEGKTECNKDMHDNEVETKINNSRTTNGKLERKLSYGNQRFVNLENDISETEKLGLRNSKTNGTMDRDDMQVKGYTEYHISCKKSRLKRDSRGFSEDVDENGMEMEMTAFKSFEALTDVRDMSRVSRMEMEERIQKLAKWLNGADINLPEWLFSKMMRSAKIRFTDHSILRVVQILGAFGNWRRVLQVLEWLQSRERFKSYKSRYIYTAALNVLGKARRPVEAFNVFHAMLQQLSSYPDLAAYHCIAVTLGQAGHLKELFDVIDCMRSPPKKKFKTGVLEKWDPRLEPDIIVYNAVLNACVRRKQWEGAFWVLQQLKQQGLQPSNTTYGLAMEVMFACGKYNLVHEFFNKVCKSSIPNALNYKVLVNTLWREGKADEAVLIVQDMERRGIVGSASLYYDLARCLCSVGRCQEALMQIDKICKVANKPLVITYTGLIQACLDSGNVQDGAYIFSEMRKLCSPNLVTCNIMLKAFVKNGMFNEAKDLFQQMCDGSSNISSKADYANRIIPDDYTFNTMLDACTAEKKWDDFKHVYQRMLDHGFHFNKKRHLRMILEASRSIKGELLDITWNHLVGAEQVPPLALLEEIFFLKLQENDCAAAISIIGHKTSELHAFSEKTWFNLFKMNSHRIEKHTLIKLIHELSFLVAGNHHPNPTFKNIISSCREFIRTHLTPHDINPVEKVGMNFSGIMVDS
uniref:Pentatricopeptide repeat-containing protein At1g30610, chloroplastic n=1 Tax=Nelumbo nucifera TaxID=4432 RepID=A0A822YXQ3_NELNU|nr:TPA_asm: hypothetical protein HUJ06_007921 [Nelumbo nucifera]